MKTLIRNDNQISLYIFEDDKTLDFTDQQIVVGDPTDYIIMDCNSSNVTLHENVTQPDNWTGWKYRYDGVWKANPDYVEPIEN